MTSNKNFKAPLKQLSSLDSYIIDNSQKKKNALWRRRSFNSAKNSNTEEIKDGTLSRSKVGQSVYSDNTVIEFYCIYFYGTVNAENCKL